MTLRSVVAAEMNEVMRPFKGSAITTGKTFWVDSVTGSDSPGKGRSKENPVATIDYANGLCTANKGDVIYVMPNHAEALTAATSLVLDVAGVTVIGLGNGNQRPQITIGTVVGACVSVTGADVTIKNCIFTSVLADVTQAILVGATDCTIENCEFTEATNLNFLICVKAGVLGGAAANACDGLTVRNCKMIVPDALNTNVIFFGQNQDRCTIEGNLMQGNFAVNVGNEGLICAVSKSAASMTNLFIGKNVMLSAAADQLALIQIHGSPTGMMWDNYGSAPDADWTPFMGAGMAFNQNYGSGALASSGRLYPLVDS